MALITRARKKPVAGTTTEHDDESSHLTQRDEIDVSIEDLFADSVDPEEVESTIGTSQRAGSLRDRVAFLTSRRRRRRERLEAAGVTDEAVIQAEMDAEVDAAVAAVAEKDAAAAQDEAELEEQPARGGIRGWRDRRRQERELAGVFANYPHLLAIKPKEGYVFRSDYYEVDGSVACVLAFFHREAAEDAFATFWGVDRVPNDLPQGVTAVVFEQMRRMDDTWIKGHARMSERLENLDSSEQNTAGTKASKQKSSRVSAELDVVTAELRNGASYFSVHNRLMLKAANLEVLDEAVTRVGELYKERFATISVSPYIAEQRKELASLLRTNEKKRGRGFHFTSVELAGSYSLVTNGINDRAGEYVGDMVGDVNNSAVLFEVNGFNDHVVVADPTVNPRLDRQRVSNMWCSKISQAALLNNHRVVHLVLDGTDLDRLGPRFDRLTSRVDMANGDVNMFEMFGDPADEQEIFAVQLEKLKLMFEQLHHETDGSMRSIIRDALQSTLVDFYVDYGMWRHNAPENRDKLRVVGLPHEDLPRLKLFVSYLATARQALKVDSSRDPDQLRAYNVISAIANQMLSSNSELFNNHTSTAIDGVNEARRVVYSFSRLVRRGKGLAMAQFVNVLGFAVSALGEGDVVIIHGAEHIDAGVKTFVTDQLSHLLDRGGRVVFSYNSVEKMLADQPFNTFDAADYTVLGPMRDPVVETYETLQKQVLPPDLRNLVTRRDGELSFVRRGKQNVVFRTDLALGINPRREAARRKLNKDAADALKHRQLQAATGADMTAGAARSSSINQAAAKAAAQRETTLRKRQRKTLQRLDGRDSAATAVEQAVTPDRKHLTRRGPSAQ